MSQRTTITIPPYFSGSDSSFLSISSQKWPSVRVGINFIYTVWSNFSRCSRLLGTVLIVHLTVCLKPSSNTKYVACGSTTAILIKTSIRLIHSKIFSSSYVFKFLCSNCSSKVSMFFIGGLNFGFRKDLNCPLGYIWINHKPWFYCFRIVTEFSTNDLFSILYFTSI